ncbi:hypothetical protein PILCRDRAFT_755455 [Piloderma croceum F 1598]|uniref:Uncharacterized protein n=1 Tax=Piloderma croceum (strain F 1598) TaxID=765440 RepID=A0A0C3AC88_PILCF|nr:hypothetical protein PILCRDRAFT_755455 [Piloderma croceum F 1598]
MAWLENIYHAAASRYETRQHKRRLRLIKPFSPPVRRRFESFFVFYFRLGPPDPTQIRFSYLNTQLKHPASLCHCGNNRPD